MKNYKGLLTRFNCIPNPVILKTLEVNKTIISLTLTWRDANGFTKSEAIDAIRSLIRFNKNVEDLRIYVPLTTSEFRSIIDEFVHNDSIQQLSTSYVTKSKFPLQEIYRDKTYIFRKNHTLKLIIYNCDGESRDMAYNYDVDQLRKTIYDKDIMFDTMSNVRNVCYLLNHVMEHKNKKRKLNK